MENLPKAEQLRLPEQLYLMLTDPETGDPKPLRRERVKRLLATAILWELMEEKAVAVSPETGLLSAADDKPSGLAYLDRALLYVQIHAPISPGRAAVELVSWLDPIWRTIGEAMAHEGLVHEDYQSRLLVFHRKVLLQLSEARRDEVELERDLREALRAVGDHHDGDVIASHRRLVGRIVLLDNFGLLKPLVGARIYNAACPHIVALKTHLRGLIQPATDEERRGAAAWTSDSGTVYWGGDTSDSSFWLLDYTSGSAPDSCGDSGSGFGGGGSGGAGASGDFGGDGGDGGGGDGGCGGCGG